MGIEETSSLYNLVGGEESYRNKLNQSPLAFRKLENLIPSLRGDLEQKPANRIFTSITTGGLGPAYAYPYYRVESDGTITKILLYATRTTGKIYKLVGTSTSPTEIFPASTGFPALNQIPVFVGAANNLCYFTDNERWYVTDGTTVQLAGLDHPVDAPTFTDAAGTLDITTNRYYWVSWATMTGEFIHWGSSSPRSLGTGALTNRAVTVTRPNHPPPRSTHWLLFASRTENEAVEGALLAVVPIATTTFEDQSPFLDQAGTVMVSISRPIRNQPMIPANFATLHKGRIFACGFNKLPMVIRNPSFDIATGAALTGWTDLGGHASVTATADTTIKYDGAGSYKAVVTASVINTDIHSQDISKILKTGRRYRVEAQMLITSIGGSGSADAGLHIVGTGYNITFGLTQASTPDVWTKVTLDFTVSTTPSTLALATYVVNNAGTRSFTLYIDFIRVWELVPPTNVAYSALEEVEGLQNGRGEESFPGSTVPPLDDDASDVINILTYPQEASELVTMVTATDNLFVLSDRSGATIQGNSFDDFSFNGVSFYLGGMHRFGTCRNRFGAFILTRDGKVMRQDGVEVSLPIRDKLASEMTLNSLELQRGGIYLTTYEYGSRSWLILSYTIASGAGRLRLYDLETQQWFKFTELDIGNWIIPITYDAIIGKRALVFLTSPDASAHDLHIVDDPLAAYTGGSVGNAPAATFRQSLFDLDSPNQFKVWKDVSVHSSAASLTGGFSTDPSDPDAATAISLSTSDFAALEQLPELRRAFLSKTTDAYGKRLLLEVILPAASTAAKVFGIEVTAESAGRYAR